MMVSSSPVTSKFFNLGVAAAQQQLDKTQPNFWDKFKSNLARAPGEIFGGNSVTGRVASMITNPSRVALQAGQGIVNSVKVGGEGIYKGGEMIGEGIKGSTVEGKPLNWLERGSRILGGATTAGREAVWIAPSMVLDPLSMIDETKEVGQAISAVPKFLDEQANKLYGSEGAYGKAVESLPMNGGLKSVLRGTGQFMEHGGLPIVSTAARVAFIKAFGKASQAAKAGLKAGFKALTVEPEVKSVRANYLPESDQDTLKQGVASMVQKYSHDANSPEPIFKGMDDMRQWLQARFGNEENWLDKKQVPDAEVKSFYNDYKGFLQMFKESYKPGGDQPTQSGKT